MRMHVSVDVANVAESVEFYQKVFNEKPQKQTEGYAKFDLKNPSLNFSMQSRKGFPVSKVSHFGIEVESLNQLSQWQERLQSQNLVKRVETQTACCFARQDKVWFEDPDGNAWEVFYVYEQLPVHPSAQEKSSCCP